MIVGRALAMGQAIRALLRVLLPLATRALRAMARLLRHLLLETPLQGYIQGAKGRQGAPRGVVPLMMWEDDQTIAHERVLLIRAAAVQREEFGGNAPCGSPPMSAPKGADPLTRQKTTARALGRL